MRRLQEIDVLGDEATQRRMLEWSWALIALGVAGGVALGIAAELGALDAEAVDLVWFVILVVVTLVALPVHELVHAAAFLLLGGPDVKVGFGFTDAMLYTSADGAMLPRARFAIVLLAPSVALTFAFALVCGATRMPLMAWWLVVLHIAGCTGDLALAAAVRVTPGCTHVLDTDTGTVLMADDGTPEAPTGRE